MIVGHVLGTVVLGFYLLAFNISSWVPGLVGTAVRYVSIPAFSRLAEGETEDVLPRCPTQPAPAGRRSWRPSRPCMVVLAPALIHVLYGDHWAPAAEALRFLAFVMVARMLTALVFDIQTGLGNTRVTVWLNLVWLVALLPALWIGAHHGGIRGAAIGHAVVALVVAIPLAGWLLHRAGIAHGSGPPRDRPSRPRGGGSPVLTMAALAWPITARRSPSWWWPAASGMVVYVLIAMPADGAGDRRGAG